MIDQSQGTLMQEQQQSSTNSMQQIEEQMILQNLSQYFLCASTKPIPYLRYFSDHTQSFKYCLAYLFSFLRADYHSKQVNSIFIKFIYLHSDDEQEIRVDCLGIRERVKQIIQRCSQKQAAFSRKVLLTRFISLPSMMAQHLSVFKLKPIEAQSVIITEICQSLSLLSEDEQIFLVNKIVMLGHAKLLLCSQTLNHIQQLYSYLTRKDAILNCILQEIVNKNSNNLSLDQFFNQIVTKYHQKQHGTLVKIIQHQHWLPSHSHLIFQTINKHRELMIAVFEYLLVWWTEGNDYYLIYNTVKFRTNTMAQCMQQFSRDQIIQYSSMIGLGIQRRLISGKENRKQIVQLIWGILAHKLDWKVSNQIVFRTNLLKDDQEDRSNNQVKEEANQQQIKQKNKGKKNIKILQFDTDQDQLPKNYQEQTQQAKQKDNGELQQFVPQAPRNLYDCILGLRNPIRKKVTLDFLPKLIRRNPDDLIFTWRDITQQLLYNLNEDSKASVVALFATRPESFVETIGQIFFKKDQSLNDKIVLMDCLTLGVEQLSERPREIERETASEQFYFKKVTSKYFNEADLKKKEERQRMPKQDSRTRRWGHTRIAYESRMNNSLSSEGVNLKILQNDPYVNRLYEIANQLFFRIISKLTLLSIFPSQPMFTVPMLKLLAILSFNLKNHFEKYKILSEIVQICKLVIDFVEQTGQKIEQPSQKATQLRKWKDTNLSVLNVLNKISLVIDQYIPNHMLSSLQKCLVKLKLSQEYGISPIIGMIEANIYTNVSGHRTPL